MAIKFSINSRKILETNSIVNISQKYLDFIEEALMKKHKIIFENVQNLITLVLLVKI